MEKVSWVRKGSEFQATHSNLMLSWFSSGSSRTVPGCSFPTDRLRVKVAMPGHPSYPTLSPVLTTVVIIIYYCCLYLNLILCLELNVV